MEPSVKVGLSSANRFRSSDVTSSGEDSVTFEELGLPEWLVDNLRNAGFDRPSPIQVRAIPLARYGVDLIVQAKAGTGKTCVFAVAALESVDVNITSPQMVILAPTREIAVQIQEVISCLSSTLANLKCRAFIGGLSVKEDMNQVKRCQIVVGTPGRIRQLLEERKFDSQCVKMLVLDEADKLLDDKFEGIVNWICSALPDKKQMLALSATYPEQLAKFLSNYMREPLYVRLDAADMSLVSLKQVIVSAIEQNENDMVKKLDQTQDFMAKQKVLDKLLRTVSFNQCLVFCNLHAFAQLLASSLQDSGWAVSFIAGSQTQLERIESLRKMRSYEIRVFVCTDLISRGIDLEHVNLVINMDVPKDWKTYMHRVGRAGRFGNKGAAVTICGSAPEDLESMKKIRKNCNLKKLMYTANVEDVPTQFIHEDNLEVEEKLLRNFTDTLRDKSEVNPDEEISKENVEEPLDACGAEVSTRSENLSIPSELFFEMRELVNLHNQIFNEAETKVKLNVQEFSFENFSRHYSHFQETGQFSSDHNWVSEERVDSVPLKMRNFFKAADIIKVETKDTSVQTDEINDAKERSMSESFHQTETGNGDITHCNLENPGPFPGSSQAESFGINFRMNVHNAYLNSAQHKYIQNAMSLYYGQQ